MWALCGLALAPAVTLRADPPAADNYRLVFADEFNGTTLDTSKWTAASPGWTMPNSASTATASDVTVGNGVLTLSANRPTSAATFNSGSISSYSTYTFTSGYVEARIKLPTTLGSWPAFWGLYNGWPPEADIMEYPLTTDGGTDGLLNTQYNTNYHYVNSAGADAAGAGAVTTSASLAGTWHTFGMDWVSSTSVKFYLDGTQVNSYTGSSVSQMAYMYMILDYAVGGWPGTPSLTQWPVGHSDSTQVDWVRVWNANPNGDSTSNWNISGGGSFATKANWTGGVPAYGNETAYFGRVGTATTAAVSMSAWQMFGGITFDGIATGTTAYTLGAASNQIQLASTTGAVTVQATAASAASQTINAGIELWSNTDFVNNMTTGQTLNINGNLSGAGTLNVDGAGTVILSGTGTYAGITTIGSNQGPAVLRVNADGALGTASVVIGTAGNATTARLELIGGHTNSNPIDFRGRNNASVAIENISGNNILSGTISANVGGGIFEIQSDSGILTLSGAATGIALASTTGARIFTLQGAGTGVISGAIQNGAGTVGIVDTGTGNWYLLGTNTYTGVTNVSAGTLNITGSITATAELLVTQGTAKINSSAILTTPTIAIGSSTGTAILTQSGGAVSTTSAVSLAPSAGGSGTYILSGGTLTAPSITRGTGTSSFDFNGGTLVPTASSITYLQGLTNGLVQTGGAVFNTNGLNLTVNQPLIHDPSIAGTDGGLTKLGNGTLTIGGAETYNGNTTVKAGTLTFAPNTTSNVLVRPAGAISVSSGATLIAGATAITSSARTLLVAQNTVSSAGTIDLGVNDLLVQSGNLNSITQEIQQGNLLSSAANADTTHLTTLAVMQNTTGSGAIFNTFDTQTATAADVLVRYTYVGDATLDGKVDGSDYSRIDSGYLLQSTGWYNGDFNDDGVINGSDYTLIDNTFNMQGAAITNQLAGPTANITDQIAGNVSAVPEPATLGLIGLAITASLARRRRSR